MSSLNIVIIVAAVLAITVFVTVIAMRKRRAGRVLISTGASASRKRGGG